MSEQNNGSGEGDALDLRLREDRNKLAQAIRRGWAVDPDRKARYMAALDDLIRSSGDLDAKDRAQLVIGANRIYQLEQAAALKDLHQQEHDARIDAGLATERIDSPAIIIQRAAPRALPDADPT